MEHVILVDEQDNEIRSMEKMEAHRKGELHRAFSVVLFNSKGEILLQKRSAHKYHSAGLWTNTCCSHPRPGESITSAAHRRLKEEMGIEASLHVMTSFIYKVELENNLIEHELDHVLIGIYDGAPSINETEVAAWKFSRLDSIKIDIKKNPAQYTFWFKEIIKQDALHKQYASLLQ